MKCKQCGAEIRNDEKFCRICGARLPAETTEAPSVEATEKKVEATPKKTEPAETSAKQKKEKKPFKLPKKAVIIAAVAVVAVIVAVVAILLIRGGGNSALNLDPERPFVVEYYDRAVVYASDGRTLASVEGHAEVQESVWGDTIVIRGIDITVVSGSVADTLGAAAYDVTVSADGSRVAYIAVAADTVPGLNDGEGGDLYVYEVESGESTFIDSDVIVDTVVLSPDGSRLAYNIFDEASDTEHTLVGKSSGKGERLLDCERMYALSNDGVYTYFANDAKFYVEKDGERTRLSEKGLYSLPALINSTGTEMLLTTADGCFYIKDGEIVDEELSASSAAMDLLGFVDEASDSPIQTVRTDSFANTVILCGGELFDVSDGARQLADCAHAVGSETGKKIAYIDISGNICVSDGEATSGEYERIHPDERPTALFADAKLEHIYFSNARAELWRLNGKKTEMVSADASSFCMSESGTLYFLYDGVVLCRADGSERVSLGRMEDFLDMESTPQGVVVKLRSGEAIYYHDDSDEGITLSTAVSVTTPTEVE